MPPNERYARLQARNLELIQHANDLQDENNRLNAKLRAMRDAALSLPKPSEERGHSLVNNQDLREIHEAMAASEERDN